jgi:hypothetical protein
MQLPVNLRYYLFHPFKGHYASDNETLSGEKVSSLDICKSEKLGL